MINVVRPSEYGRLIRLHVEMLRGKIHELEFSKELGAKNMWEVSAYLKPRDGMRIPRERRKIENRYRTKQLNSSTFRDEKNLERHFAYQICINAYQFTKKYITVNQQFHSKNV